MNQNLGPILFFLLLPLTSKSSLTQEWFNPRETPTNTMTDIINDLGLKILNCYSTHQHGNVAFSPTGLAFVLAALYEASGGNTRHQIAHVLGLPQDKRVTRIGLRDIHRRLRSYLNANAFLGGLTLNRDDITLRPDYEELLRFYGFDLVNSTLANSTSATPPTISNSTTNATNITTISPETSTQPDSTSSPLLASSSSTISPDIEILTDQGTNLTDSPPNSALNQSNPSLLPTESPTLPIEQTSLPTVPSNTSPEMTTLPTEQPSIPIEQPSLPIERPSLPTVPPNASPEMTTLPTMAENVTELPTEPTVASIESQNTTPVASKRRRSIDPDGNLPTTLDLSSDSSSLSSESFEIYDLPTKFNLFSTLSTKLYNLSTESTSLPSTTPTLLTESSNLPAEATSLPSSENLPTGSSLSSSSSRQPEKLSNLPTVPSNLPTDPSNLPTEPSNLSNLLTVSTSLPTDPSNLPTEQTVLPTLPLKKRRSTNPDFQNWLPDVNPWKPSLGVDGIALDFDNSDYKPSELNFFTDGTDLTSISTVMYTTVLPFCYFPSLGTAAVEFPLDDPRYTVVILLPDRDVGTLVKDLRASGVKLRKLREVLTPYWIRAAIPSFMLKGFVTLTGWVQKLGIIDAFEPRNADLSIMTPDLGVYARDVHQSIGVNIRNFEPDGLNETQRGNPRGEPIHFIADRPFIFFIIDTETSVSLIAGRVNDPLNSRII